MILTLLLIFFFFFSFYVIDDFIEESLIFSFDLKRSSACMPFCIDGYIYIYIYKRSQKDNKLYRLSSEIFLSFL